MASIVRDRANGTRGIAVVLGPKRRPVIRLGKCSRGQAQSAKSYIEDLVACWHLGTAPNAETAAWVAKIPEVIRKRIEKAGLIGERAQRAQVPTLGAWLDTFIGLRRDLKPGTLCNFHQTRRLLLEHFPADKPLDRLTHGEAEDFSLWLKTERGLAEGTARRQLRRCKQVFAAAIKRKMLAENPFDGIKCSGFAPDRFYFISLAETQAVLDACPDAEWRLIFALARFGGLRVPSEILPLTWGDVNWEKSRFTVHSPKTEHLDGKGTRIVPMFPELLPYLRDAFEAAEPGTVHLITRYRQSNVNLRTQLLRIIKQAGLSPWVKPFQNLRSTRETELVERFPVHVVTAWLGNSPDVARKHYLQLTDAHFEKAIGGGEKSVAETVAETERKPKQRAATQKCEDLRERPDSERNPDRDGTYRNSPEPVASSRNSTHVDKSYPARIRTWNIRTKT